MLRSVKGRSSLWAKFLGVVNMMQKMRSEATGAAGLRIQVSFSLSTVLYLPMSDKRV